MTKRKLVEKAFGSIGLKKFRFPLTADMMIDAVEMLDAMMAAWSADGVYSGYYEASPADTDPDQESGLASLAYEAVYTNLGLRLAPGVGKVTSDDTRKTAKEAKNVLEAWSTKQISDVQLPNNLPRGAGNKPWRQVGGQYFQTSTQITVGRGGADLLADGEPLDVS